MKVTVVGSGHGGCAMAAVMGARGHDVSLLKLGSTMHADNFERLERTRRIQLLGIEGTAEVGLAEVTRDPARVIPEAELVLVYYVANYHELVARAIAPLLHGGQTVVLNPGYAGSLIFRRTMAAVGNHDLPLFAEFETLPYSSRISSPGSVSIVSRNVRHPFATYPAGRSGELIEHVGSVLGVCIPRTHILEVALHNPNVIIHTAGVLLNPTRVEGVDKPFAMYKDGFSPSVWNVVERLDSEKMDVLEAIGAPRTSYFDEFKLRTFEDLSIDSLSGFRHYASEAPDGPFTLNHRYVTEDVPMGLGLLHSLGALAGVRTPICDSLIHLASAMLPERDFWREARTIDRLWDGTLDSLLRTLTASAHVAAAGL